jgi:hypothetical protein
MSSPSGHMTTLSQEKIHQFQLLENGVGSLATRGEDTATPERDLTDDMAVLGKSALMNTAANQGPLL